MSATSWALYAGYLVWLAAGCIDFLCHRRTDLPYTSGLPESLLHLAQTTLMGGLVIAWLLWAPSLGLSLLLAALVVLHAAAGYADTWFAWRRRPITPVEQHVHSVLDAAPWAVLAMAIYRDGAAALAQGWTWALRTPAVAQSVWLAVLGPAALLCLLPLASELRAAWRAMADVRGRP